MPEHPYWRRRGGSRGHNPNREYAQQQYIEAANVHDKARQKEYDALRRYDEYRREHGDDATSKQMLREIEALHDDTQRKARQLNADRVAYNDTKELHN